MTFLVLAFLTSTLITLLVVHSSDHHAHRSADYDLTGPQKFHAEPVPRIGGVGIFASLLACSAFAQFTGRDEARMLWVLLLCSLPAFISGLTEDLTKAVTPRWRLLFTAVAAALAVWLLDAVIRRTDIPGLDTLVVMAPFAVALTIFVVTGVANAINIIDGFNGLASMCVLMMLLAVAYVAFQVGDMLIFSAALICTGAVLGFFVWNYPAGLIFLGDGGAYLLGFLLAELCVLLMHRNPTVSPIFALLLCAYPIFETVFTMYRRKFVRGVATGAPDGIHLHTLIHRRLVRWSDEHDDQSPEQRQTVRNSRTSPYLWLLCLMSVIPSVLWWNNTLLLTVFLFLFMLSYTLLYASIVRFRTPKWLVFRR